MTQGFVGIQFRRTSRNVLVFNSALLLLILTLTALSVWHEREFATDPQPATLQDIAQLSGAGTAPHSHVHVAIDPLRLDPGYVCVSYDQINTYYRFLLFPDNRVMIVRSGSKNIPDEFDAYVEKCTVDSMVTEHVKDDLRSSMLPVMLEISSLSRRQDWLMSLAFGLMVSLIFVWFILRALRHLLNPLTHPAARQLAQAGPLEEIASAIDQEVFHAAVNLGDDLAYYSPVVRVLFHAAKSTGFIDARTQPLGVAFGSVLLTDSWLIKTTVYSVKFLPLEQIAWVYQQEATSGGGMNMRRAFATILFDVRGNRWEFKLGESQKDGVISHIQSRVPWAVVGFSSELHTLWVKSRATFLNDIENRKARYIQGTTQSPPNPT